jgi:hypothetical protein
MKVVINKCYGGFGLSQKAVNMLEAKGIKTDIMSDDQPEFRSHPKLIEVVEELKEEAGDRHADLHIVEIPDYIQWYIEEYDGMEHVAEIHRTWR